MLVRLIDVLHARRRIQDLAGPARRARGRLLNRRGADATALAISQGVHSSVITAARSELEACVSALVACPANYLGLDDRILVGLGLHEASGCRAIRPRRGAGA